MRTSGCVRRPFEDGKVLRPLSLDPTEGKVLERHQREWFALQSGVPGAEVHNDPDVVWKVENGLVWSNAATGLRFSSETVERRLDRIIQRFAEHGRGGGFWVDADATPMDLETQLKKRGFRCRKHFPGMACRLLTLPRVSAPDGIKIGLENSYSAYSVHPHPLWGRINTAIRRYELSRSRHLSAAHPDRVFDFVAVTSDKQPVGACTLFLSKFAAGIHSVGVIEDERGKGIGSALIGRVLRFARDRGHQRAVLLSSEMGVAMYERVGFREVCRIGYWYRASFTNPKVARRS